MCVTTRGLLRLPKHFHFATPTSSTFLLLHITDVTEIRFRPTYLKIIARFFPILLRNGVTRASRWWSTRPMTSRLKLSQMPRYFDRPAFASTSPCNWRSFRESFTHISLYWKRQMFLCWVDAGHEKKKKKLLTQPLVEAPGMCIRKRAAQLRSLWECAQQVSAQSDLIRSHKLWTASTSRLCNLRQGFVVVPAFLNENKNKLTQLRSSIE